MEHISVESLNTLEGRVSYLKRFLNFTSADTQALHAAKPVVAPLIPSILDTVYTKLTSFDITAASFLPRNTGYEGEVPTKVEDLNLSHPQIVFRKDFLKNYLVRLVTANYDSDKTWEYLDKVGLMHTGTGRKKDLRVEYIHLGALLGLVVDIVLEAVINHPTLSNEDKLAVTRAFNKVLWIQNDLFARHYLVSGPGQ